MALTGADWDWALTINLLAAVRTTRAALPHLLDRAPATIVTRAGRVVSTFAGHRFARIVSGCTEAFGLAEPHLRVFHVAALGS